MGGVFSYAISLIKYPAATPLLGGTTRQTYRRAILHKRKVCALWKVPLYEAVISPIFYHVHVDVVPTCRVPIGAVPVGLLNSTCDYHGVGGASSTHT